MRNCVISDKNSTSSSYIFCMNCGKFFFDDDRFDQHIKYQGKSQYLKYLLDELHHSQCECDQCRPSGEEVGETDEIIRGFRAYSIREFREKNGSSHAVLRGGANVLWHRTSLSAACKGLYTTKGKTKKSQLALAREHILLGKEKTTMIHYSHPCGVYIAKTTDQQDVEMILSSASYTYGGISVSYARNWRGVAVLAQVVGWGAFEEFELAYRVEHCRIEQLAIVAAEATLARYYDQYKKLADQLRTQYQVPVKEVTYEAIKADNPFSSCCGNSQYCGRGTSIIN